jgi:hypothetical protein
VSLGPDDLPHTADDAQVAGAQPNYLPGALVARLEAPLSLPAGLYQVRVGLGLTDRSGNPLANPETWTFRVFHLDATLEPTFTLYGHIDRPGATDSYSFLVSAGQRLFFRLPEFDLWSQTAPEVGWWLLAPDGSAVYRGTLGYQTLGTVTFTDPGLYTFVFGGDTYSDTGEFQIVCTPVPEAQVFAIAIGEQVDLNAPASGAGWIEASGAHDLYTFSVVAGTSVNLRLTATSEGLTYNNWTLRDPTGTPVFSRYLGWGDPGRIALEQGGVYTLDVGSDTDPGTGTYGFSLEP